MLPATPEPKPTIYNRIQFRSRLEARWAVLFDALDLAWEYEPVTFTFSPQNWQYTPDFRVNVKTRCTAGKGRRATKRPGGHAGPALGPPFIIEVKPTSPEPIYFQAMELIDKQGQYQTAIGCGSFFKEYPRIHHDERVSVALSDWIVSSFALPLGFVNRAMKSASGYRFDLR